MKKIILKILIIISIAIVIFGIFAGRSVKDQVRNEGMPTQNIYIDGTDATDFVKISVEFGSGLLQTVIIGFSIFIVICIWGVYGIILLILYIIKNVKKEKILIK